MKKVFTLPKSVRANRRHANRSMRAMIKHRIWKSKRRFSKPKLAFHKILTSTSRQSYSRIYNRIKVPDNFSMVDNPDEVIELIQRLKTFVEAKQSVELLMKDIKKLGYDAIVVLLAILYQFKSQKVDVKGDLPKDSTVRKLLSDSGFFEKLAVTFEAADWFAVAGTAVKSMYTHANTKVDSELGQSVVKKASKVVWQHERRCQGVQRALIELMQNTNNHASDIRQGEKHWWLSVNEKPTEKKVCFTFVDFGIGVFESLKRKPSTSKWFGGLTKLWRRQPYKNNADLLRLILDGVLHETATGQSFRGKGLPGLKQVMKRNQLSRLHVITNNAYANVENEEYRILDKEFTGTFVYWELIESNTSCHG